MARIVSLSLLGGVLGRSEIDPVGKVITLLESLHQQCTTDAQSEAEQYAKFKGFCSGKSEEKSAAITKGKDGVAMLSAEIATKTATKKEKNHELEKTKSHKEKKMVELDDTNARCEKEKEVYLAENDDTLKALGALANAIQSVADSKPGAAADLLAVKATVRSNPALDEAMKALDGGAKWSSFLQVDPLDAEYKFHSGGLLDLLKELEAQFTSKKDDRDAEWKKTLKSCTETKSILASEIETATAEIGTLEVAINELEVRLAEAEGERFEMDNQLKDDELYFGDLTQRCNNRARDNEQRSEARADEIAAIGQALDILKNKVKEATDVNVRALLQKDVGLAAVQKHDAFAFAQISKKVVHGTAEQSQQDAAVKILKNEGNRLKSTVLLSLVSRAGASPFTKVKGLIETLIERLIKEARAETEKKGFCDEAMGKATKSRDYRQADATRLSAQIGELEAKKDALVSESAELKTNIKDLQSALKEMTEMREDESKDNAETLSTAKDGLKAVTEAVSILQAYYKSAAKNDKYHSGELEKIAFVRVSPVDIDEQNPGAAKGAYKGQQGSSKGVIGLLEVIQTDFRHTITTVTAEEKKAHADFVEAERMNKMTTKKKETKLKLDTEDLAETNSKLESKYEDLSTATSLLDNALKELEKLRPTCVDSGMSYTDRKRQREEEICALKWAREMLRPPEKKQGSVDGCAPLSLASVEKLPPAEKMPVMEKPQPMENLPPMK